jgi:carbamoyltransferase
MTTWILGISASHNGAACLLRGSEIVVAIQEERLTRIKRRRVEAGRDFLAARYCLERAGITPGDLAMIVVSTQHARHAPENDVALNPYLRPGYHGVPVVHMPHHLAHAYSVYATSGYRDAAVLVIDGVGSSGRDLGPKERAVARGSLEAGWESISLYAASPAAMTPLAKELPDGKPYDPAAVGMSPFRSLGGMFMAASHQIFGDAMDAGKVMGLAPYGQPTIPVREFLEVERGQVTFTSEVIARFPGTERWPAARTAYQDLAASVQVALETALFSIADELRTRSGLARLCYAGGVALNSSANEKLIERGTFDEVFILPAAEDSGVAIGAAYYGLERLGGGKSLGRRLDRDSPGRPYDTGEIAAAIAAVPRVAVSDVGDVIARSVDLLTDGKIGAWFDGGSELGPRSLGQRSILCDPRRDDAKEVLNARVKHREAFRPFAPVILAEDARDWFDFAGAADDSPFMLRVCAFKPEKRHLVPAVVHVDGTGRAQTVTADQHPRLHALLRAFKARTGVPILLNTSLNVMGEPIVETPEDALWCLLLTDLDFCAFPDRIVTRAPSFRSLLDLVPSVAASRLDIGFAVRDARLSLELAGAEMRAWVATRWGSYPVPLDPLNAAILEEIDGKTPLGELLDRLATTLDTPRAALAAAIRRLQTTRIVTFA